MTAEIAILNKEAVAMAADSAVTITTYKGKKILPSANKIFSLSKCHPVGIMVYGSASLMETPWETIIKMFRHELGNKEFDTLQEYATAFISFIKSRKEFYPESDQLAYLKSVVSSYYSDIQNDIEESFERTRKGKTDRIIPDKTAKQIMLKIFNTHLRLWNKSSPVVEDYEKEYESFKKKYSKNILQVQKEHFKKLTLTQSKVLLDIAIMFFLKYSEEYEGSNVSGVVVAGFGKKEIFPSIKSFEIDGIANNVLKYKEDKQPKINSENSAGIVPFAQKEMVYSFMEGINPQLEMQMYDIIYKIITAYPKILLNELINDDKSKEQLGKKLTQISKDLKGKIFDSLEHFRTNMFVQPVLTVVKILSKSELADMAEALVNLSVFKKRMSMEDETIGGPVDVVVISKGDGLIWIKRKLYFNPELNKHFFDNYYNFDKKNQ